MRGAPAINMDGKMPAMEATPTMNIVPKIDSVVAARVTGLVEGQRSMPGAEQLATTAIAAGRETR
jgi:hypothetical protein